jgi:hypothetical protein
MAKKPPKKMPLGLKALGFSEDEWYAFQDWKEHMGDVQEVIEKMRELNDEIRTGLLEIKIIKQMMWQADPQGYGKACEALGIRTA